MNPTLKKYLHSSVEAVFQNGVWALLVALVAVVGLWAQKVSGAWLDRGLGFVLGILVIVVVVLLARAIREYVSTRKAKRLLLQKADKGFLDFKLQAETSIARIPSMLEKLTAMLTDVGRSMDAHRIKLIAASSSTSLQLKRIRQASKALNRYSEKMDSSICKLETEAKSLNEGTFGWLEWMNKQEDREPILKMETILSPFIRSMEEPVATLEKYILVIESLRGVSRDLNAAVDGHAKVVRRLKAIIEGMRSSLSRTLQDLKRKDAKRLLMQP